MHTCLEMTASIRDILVSSWPHRFSPEELLDDIPVGEQGLGLDSVEVAELLLACEEHCGRAMTEQLFEEVPLTIQRVAAHFAAA